MSDVVALSAFEHVPLDVVADIEQLAARRVGRGVATVGACNAFNNRALGDGERKGESERGDELLEGHGCPEDAVTV